MSIVMLEAGEEWGLSDFERGFLSMSLTFGVYLGCFVWGYVADAYGRIKTFWITGISSFLSISLLCTAFNIEMLCIFYFLTGFALIGDFVVAGTMLNEFLPNGK